MNRPLPVPVLCSCSLSWACPSGFPHAPTPFPALFFPRVGLYTPSPLEAGLSAAIPHAPPIHSHAHAHANFLFLSQFILFLFINGRPIRAGRYNPRYHSVSRSLHVGECNSPLQPTLPLPSCWWMQFAPT